MRISCSKSVNKEYFDMAQISIIMNDESEISGGSKLSKYQTSFSEYGGSEGTDLDFQIDPN